MQTFVYGKTELKTTKFFSTIFSSKTYGSQCIHDVDARLRDELLRSDTMRDFKFSTMREKMVTIILI